ncbi:MAG: hypothetical protein RL026_435 [Pseudomonadota bacterium]|jgi:phospholipid transport system transporter-binding protein
MATGGAQANLVVIKPGHLALAGSLGFDTVTALWPACRSALAGVARGGSLQVSLTGVSHSDSAGLSLLVSWLSAARAAGVSLHYTQVPARLLGLARISEVDRLLLPEG